MRRILIGLALILLLGAAALQAVPYGRDHTNPAVRAEPRWDSAATRQLAVRACFDCHSNETEWPWYSNVAPVSWLIQRDVDDGRRALNFSEWHRPQEEAGESARTLREGEMPPWYYAVRPGTRLSAVEREALAWGLEATLVTERRPGRAAGGKSKTRED